MQKGGMRAVMLHDNEREEEGKIGCWIEVDEWKVEKN